MSMCEEGTSFSHHGNCLNKARNMEMFSNMVSFDRLLTGMVCDLFDCHIPLL